MDENRFDDIGRSLARGANGRRRLLGGALGVALFALLGGEATRAKQRGHRRKKRRCPAARRCAGRCCPPGAPCCGACCLPGATCDAASGQCVNGALAVGDPCPPTRPGECASGVCGCNGPVRPCTCRIEACLATGADCTLTGTVGCCKGVCSGVNPPFFCVV